MSPRVLIIEDDSKLAPLLRRFLEDNHFEVHWAADGELGWRDFGRLAPDLVVLDLMLPGRDGLTLCRQIRAAGDTGILILTASRPRCWPRARCRRLSDQALRPARAAGARAGYPAPLSSVGGGANERGSQHWPLRDRRRTAPHHPVGRADRADP